MSYNHMYGDSDDEDRQKYARPSKSPNVFENRRANVTASRILTERSVSPTAANRSSIDMGKSRTKFKTIDEDLLSKNDVRFVTDVDWVHQQKENLPYNAHFGRPAFGKQSPLKLTSLHPKLPPQMKSRPLVPSKNYIVDIPSPSDSTENLKRERSKPSVDIKADQYLVDQARAYIADRQASKRAHNPKHSVSLLRQSTEDSRRRPENKLVKQTTEQDQGWRPMRGISGAMLLTDFEEPEQLITLGESTFRDTTIFGTQDEKSSTVNPLMKHYLRQEPSVNKQRGPKLVVETNVIEVNIMPSKPPACCPHCRKRIHGISRQASKDLRNTSKDSLDSTSSYCRPAHQQSQQRPSSGLNRGKVDRSVADKLLSMVAHAKDRNPHLRSSIEKPGNYIKPGRTARPLSPMNIDGRPEGTPDGYAQRHAWYRNDPR